MPLPTRATYPAPSSKCNCRWHALTTTRDQATLHIVVHAAWLGHASFSCELVLFPTKNLTVCLFVSPGGPTLFVLQFFFTTRLHCSALTPALQYQMSTPVNNSKMNRLLLTGITYTLFITQELLTPYIPFLHYRKGTTKMQGRITKSHTTPYFARTG